MKKTTHLIITLVLALALSFTHSNIMNIDSKAYAGTQTLTISAAISLKDVLLEVQRNFEKQNKQIKLIYNLGSSGTLEKQIEAGAPVDIFISADKKNIDKLQNKSLIDKKSIQVIAENKLVLVAYKGSSYKIKTIKDLTKSNIENISIGTPLSVPAGDYAKEALAYYKIWDKVSPKIIYAKDVSQVLNYVRLGNVDAGLVYLTDAKKKSDVIIKQVLPEESHSKIVYEGAIIGDSQNKIMAAKFMNYLKSSQAKIILNKYSFTTQK